MTRQLLAVASAFEGPFSFEVAAAAADLGEADALDEALAAHLLQPSGGGEAHAFAHALIRHTVYGELSSPAPSAPPPPGGRGPGGGLRQPTLAHPGR